LEIERRFLVDLDKVPVAAFFDTWRIEDRYLECGLLRLRHQKNLATNEEIWKLAKKYHSDGAFVRPMTNIYLSVDEFAAITTLPHHLIEKTRHHLLVENKRWAVDVFDGALAGLVLAEVETQSLAELEAMAPAFWTRCELTYDPFFTGGNLARTTADSLKNKLDEIAASLP
jgi:CYTH domain-containing protein